MSKNKEDLKYSENFSQRKYNGRKGENTCNYFIPGILGDNGDKKGEEIRKTE